jgi:hypothetical protein
MRPPFTRKRGQQLGVLAHAAAAAMAEDCLVVIKLADGSVQRGKIVRRRIDVRLLPRDRTRAYASSVILELNEGGWPVELNDVVEIKRDQG